MPTTPWVPARTLALVLGVALAASCTSADPLSSPPDSSTSSPDSSTSPLDAGARSPLCGPSTKKGSYCGSDEIEGGDPDTLYTCAGPLLAPTGALACANGCTVAPSGSDDACTPVATPSDYELPWLPGTTMKLTQDCDDSCCNDHVGNDEYAWDWSNGSGFTVRAARAGVITHLKINSTTGCATTACSTDVNMLVIDHGDGTQAIYMHLRGDSAQAGVTCGASVVAGQPLAIAGTTGHSTGVHLHFQVSQVHTSAPTCECGTDGKQCATTFNPFPDTWVGSAYKTVPISFGEWPSSSMCSDRRITMPPAAN